MARTYHIEYVGPGLGGKRTSLAALLNAVGQAPKHGESSYELIWHGQPLTVGLAVVRAWLWHDPARWPDVDPRIAEELERLATADGLVFVLDAQDARMEANEESLASLSADLARFGRAAAEVPTVFQLNKRDLPGTLGLEAVRPRFTARRARYVESVATAGTGVGEAMTALLELIES